MSETWATFERVGTVIAVQLQHPLEWSTQGGAAMTGEVGDWVVTDSSGGRRTVTDASFRATHAHDHGDTWRRTSLVQARHACPGESVATQEGVEVAGDEAAWVIRDVAGNEWIAPDKHFLHAYRPVVATDHAESDGTG